MDISIFRIHSKLIELTWPKVISESTLSEQLVVKQFLENEYGEGIREIRVGFNTLSLKLRIEITEQDCIDLLEEILQLPDSFQKSEGKLWKIPVCYDSEFGKDLVSLALTHRISTDELIEIHSVKIYTLHFYGFIPGFMYLGGLDERLFTPRKNSPERSIPPGTVAIGGQQTGIYPSESPGGWHAIGRCPIKLFDINLEIPVIPDVGDKVKFEPISRESFFEIQNQSIKGLYLLKND
jgi:inhibitor of KinA